MTVMQNALFAGAKISASLHAKAKSARNARPLERTAKEATSMRYSDFSIEENRKWLVETAMKESTPKRYTGHLYEAAEEIAQLRSELKMALETMKEMVQDVERIRQESDCAMAYDSECKLADFCGRYCKNAGNQCFKEGDEFFACENWKWKGAAT